MTNPSIFAAFERMWQHVLAKFNNYVPIEMFDNDVGYATQASLDEKANSEHEHDANDITSGILYVENGGTGYNSIVDNTYTTARYRASALVSAETTPNNNGIINWVYE